MNWSIAFDYFFRFLLVVTPPVCLWVLNKWKKEEVKKLMAATTGAMQELIALQLNHQLIGRDPKSYHTLDLEFPGGGRLCVPMIPGVPVTVLENIEITVTSHTNIETIATFVCKGHGHLEAHCHPTHDETVTVIAGTMTDLDTGTTYRAGDVWHIPRGTYHAANFDNAVMLLRYIPPLPLASDRPVNLDAMKTIFPP